MSLFRRRALGALEFVLIALSISALSHAAAKSPPPEQAPPLGLVSTEWPPFTDAPGKPRFALDLVEAAFARVGMTSRTTIVPAGEFTKSLLSPDFSGSAAAWKDAEREKTLIFSQPYLENRLLLVGQKGSDVSATTFAALKGKRIAIVGGYSYGDQLAAAGPEFVRTATEEASLEALLTGSVDYTLMDELVVRYITSRYSKQSQARLQFGEKPIVTRPLHLAIRRDYPNAQAIIDRFNTQLRAMLADRTYHKLLHLDWINADVDGDGIAEFVAASDSVGASAPKSAYALMMSARDMDAPEPSGTASRFNVGGKTYSDWDSVPSRFKFDDDSGTSASNSGQGNVFTFRW